MPRHYYLCRKVGDGSTPANAHRAKAVDYVGAVPGAVFWNYCLGTKAWAVVRVDGPQSLHDAIDADPDCERLTRIAYDLALTPAQKTAIRARLQSLGMDADIAADATPRQIIRRVLRVFQPGHDVIP